MIKYVPGTSLKIKSSGVSFKIISFDNLSQYLECEMLNKVNGFDKGHRWKQSLKSLRYIEHDLKRINVKSHLPVWW